MAKKKDRSDYHTPSLVRALEIIEYLSDRPEGVAINDLARTLKIPFNSAYRLSMTLLDCGYLLRDESTKRLCLSMKMLQVGQKALGHVSLVETALVHMRELQSALSVTVILGARLGDEGVILESVAGGFPFKFAVDAGVRFVLHASAPGKAMLAYMPEKECDELISRMKFTRYNKRTITTPRALLAELDEVREVGYALDRAEQFDAVHCVAAPIMLDTGYPAASIWATAPAERLPAKSFARVGEKVREHADAISRRLGYGLVDRP